MHELLRSAGGFALALLAGDQEAVAQHFARGVPPFAHWHGIERRRARPARRSRGRARLDRGAPRRRALGRRPRVFVGGVVAVGDRALGPGLVHRAGVRLAVIEAVVFDLDGVIVDSEHVWDEVRQELAEERAAGHDRGLAGHDGDELARVVALHARRDRARQPPRRSTPRSCGGWRPATASGCR